MSALTVYIGWDPREERAYEVACGSMRRRASKALEIHPLKLSDLRRHELYWREDDPLASTEFTYSRFLTPFLARQKASGFALFCDCDFLWLGDVSELFDLADTDKAVQCVKHDYIPTETTKMDGKSQTAYRRKNWSSLMLFNCDHPSVADLTPERVNCASGAYLHQMGWADDGEIGSLPETWNWLEGINASPPTPPKAVHFTRGGPWFELWRHVQYADLWLAEEKSLELERRL